MSPWPRIATTVLVVAIGTLGCADTKTRRATKNPQALRNAYAEALRDDDPKAAYALLSEGLRAELTYEVFEARWRAHPDERARALEALERADTTVLATGTTAHDNGAVVRWVEVDGKFVVSQGLPGLPDRSTPTSTIRAFIAAARAVDRRAVSALLDDELREKTDEALKARADAIEAALRQPGAFDFEQDRTRAILRYGEPGRAPGQGADRKVVLELGDAGWSIVSF